MSKSKSKFSSVSLSLTCAGLVIRSCPARYKWLMPTPFDYSKRRVVFFWDSGVALSFLFCSSSSVEVLFNYTTATATACGGIITNDSFNFSHCHDSLCES